MNRRSVTSWSLALAAGGIVLFAIAGLVWASGGGPTGVQALGIATATPTATATTTPAPAPPAAPSNLDIEGSNLVWEDNSDNEDGFRIRVSVGGGPPEVRATLPADTTSAPLPLPGISPEEYCEGVTPSVVAFNDAGESEPAVGSTITAFCDPVALPTATVAEIVSPPTGGGPGGGGDARWPFAAAGFGLALVALGGAAGLRLRARGAHD